MDSQTILLVEDNPGDIELTKRAFSKCNIANELVVVEDGEEALDYLFCTGSYVGRNCRDLPTVVLLDLNLPKINGLEVLNSIRANAKTKRLPVVIMTSSNEEKDITSAYNGGANSYVRKPVDYHEFVEAVKILGLYWLVINENPELS